MCNHNLQDGLRKISMNGNGHVHQIYYTLTFPDISGQEYSSPRYSEGSTGRQHVGFTPNTVDMQWPHAPRSPAGLQ